MLSILVATDSSTLRDALRSIITPTKDMKLIGCIENHAEIIPRARELSPDLVILDTSFVPDSLASVIDTIVGQNSKVLLIGGEMDNAQIIDALFRGASGVIGRKSTADLVCRSIRAVVSGEFWISRQVTSKLIEVLRTESHGDGNGNNNPAIARMLNRTNRPPGTVSGDNKFGLTKRELQVISALVEGQSNKDIAATFGVSEYTVKHHLTNVFDKLGVYNRLELVLFAIRHQLCIAPDEAAVTTVPEASAPAKKSPRQR